MNNDAEMHFRTSSNFKPSSLEPFFAPKGVAVIGASPKKNNQGKRIVESLLAHHFPGEVYSVHPKGAPVFDRPVVRSIQDLPNSIDLAISAVSSSRTLELIQPLANKGIKYLIVVGGGFAETDEAGQKLQDKLKESARTSDISVIGPNCLGTFSSKDCFNSFFLSPDDLRLPGAGPVGIISQSGAFLSMMLNGLAERGVGVHRAINFGNRVDVGECEAFEAFANDPAIKVIGLYLESFQNGNRFFDLARETSRTKPVLIYKGGKRKSGSRAAQAHSAALAGSYEVFQSVCRQIGVLEVNGLTELINGLHSFSLAPRQKGKRLLIISNGGGMGVLLTDMCERNWDIQEPSSQVQDALFKKLPSYYSLKNPIDLTGSGENSECIEVVKVLTQSKEFNALLLALLPGTMGITASITQDLKTHLPKGIPVAIAVCGEPLYTQLNSELSSEGFPVFSSGEEAAWSINLLAKREASISCDRDLPSEAINEYKTTLLSSWLQTLSENPGEMELKQQLAKCGIPVPNSSWLRDVASIDKAVEKTGLPLVLKVSGKDVLHKSEIGGIRPDLQSREEVAAVWGEMNALWPDQIWAEQQMPAGLDLMVGVQRDPDFGTILIFGTGGQFVEVYQDVERIRLPSDTAEIVRSILKTKAGQIIEGVRGSPPLDLARLLSVIRFLEKCTEETPKLQSLDINPLRLYPNGLIILDAKLTF